MAETSLPNCMFWTLRVSRIPAVPQAQAVYLVSVTLKGLLVTLGRMVEARQMRLFF